MYVHMQTQFFLMSIACGVEKLLLSVFASTLRAVRSMRPLLPECLGEISQLMMNNRLLARLFIWQEERLLTQN